MFTTFLAWLKSTFSPEPSVLSQPGCGNCESCKCPDSAHVNIDVVVAAEDTIVAPPRKSSRKPRTPKV